MHVQGYLNPTALKAKIGFSPTKPQQAILEGLKRFTLLCGGKRSGKTYLISYLTLRELLYARRTVWVVAPTYNLTKRVWDYLEVWATREFVGVLSINKTEMAISNAVTGSKVEFKSADNPISLKGQGLSMLIVDEAGDIADNVWDKFLRPNIAESRPELNGEKSRVVIVGNASRIGTWFHRLFKDERITDKFAYHLPTAIENAEGVIVGTSNPLVSTDELQEIKNTSSVRVWQQEYLARWMTGEGQVFRGVRDCINNDLQLRVPAKHGRLYYIGVDLGRKQDFTVISVLDAKTYELVDFERFKTLDWRIQKQRIINTSQRYNNAMVVMDETGLGDTIGNELYDLGLNMFRNKDGRGVIFTNELKKNVIEKLVMFIEQKQIHYPEILELISELESYEYKLTKTGKVEYNAPQGLHDDCVISLALATWELPAIRPARMPVEVRKLSIGDKVNLMLDRGEPVSERVVERSSWQSE